MATTTKIQWCDHTFNPIRGCAKVSPGCQHCYAELMSIGEWGPEGKRVIASEPYWRLPLAWNKAAAKAGQRRRVFCASVADVFEDRPELIVPRCRLLSLIHRTPQLDWLLLTKQPEGIKNRLTECASQEDEDHGDGGQLGINDGACLASQWKYGSPLSNAWLGVSVEDQLRADERIPFLLQVPAAVRFLSVEPLLGPVDLSPYLVTGGIHWVIIGGES